MSTGRTQLRVRDVEVDVHYKDIKNLHLAVYPPDGHVRIAAPQHMDDEQIRLAVVQRLDWIKRHQRQLRDAVRQSQREMVTGESHYVWGVRYRLTVIEADKRPSVNLVGRRLVLQVQPGTDVEHRRRLLSEWYRQQLKEQLTPLIAKWQPVIGRSVAHWGIRKMKTRWGSCNSVSGRLLFNLDLAQKSPPCVEYVVVHELIHLIERLHTDRFRDLLSGHLPRWEIAATILNASLLSDQNWSVETVELNHYRQSAG